MITRLLNRDQFVSLKDGSPLSNLCEWKMSTDLRSCFWSRKLEQKGGLGEVGWRAGEFMKRASFMFDLLLLSLFSGLLGTTRARITNDDKKDRWSRPACIYRRSAWPDSTGIQDVTGLTVECQWVRVLCVNILWWLLRTRNVWQWDVCRIQPHSAATTLDGDDNRVSYLVIGKSEGPAPISTHTDWCVNIKL